MAHGLWFASSRAWILGVGERPQSEANYTVLANAWVV